MKFCIWCVALALAFIVGLTIGFFFLAPEVQIAVIGALKEGWVALVNNAASASAAAIATGGAVMTWWNGQKAKAAVVAAEGAQAAAAGVGAVLGKKLDENTQLTHAVGEAAVRSAEEVENAKLAGVREGHVAGMEIERMRASNFGGLGPNATQPIDITKGPP